MTTGSVARPNIGRLHCGDGSTPPAAIAPLPVARPNIGRLHCGFPTAVAHPAGIGRLHCGEPPSLDIGSSIELRPRRYESRLKRVHADSP